MMRIFVLLPVLIVMSMSFSAAQDAKPELRTWTSIIGTTVEAELVSLTGNQVTLKTKAGKTIKLPLNKLSKTDQEFLKAKSSPKEATKEEAPISPHLKYEIKDGAVTITACDKKASGELTIPATIEGNPVTSIGNDAFRDCTSLTSITIPDGVTSIGNYTFFRCTNLESVTIPDSVTSIGNDAFAGCAGLTSITIPDSVTSIGSHAFQYCSSLANVTIGNGVSDFQPFAFQGCTRLSIVTFLGDNPITGGIELLPNSTFLTTLTIYRKPESKGWGEIWGFWPVKLISEKP